VVLSSAALVMAAGVTSARAASELPSPAVAAALPPEAGVSSAGAVITPVVAAAAVRSGQRYGTSSSTGTVKLAPVSIIGPDNRYRINPTTGFPARATVLINRNGSLHCTGWMVSKDTLLTAGHCVHTGGSGGSWYSGLSFRAGSNGGTAPYGTCLSRGTWALNGWVNSGDTRYDAAIIKLNCTVGNTVGWYGMYWQTASLNGTSITVQGYPGDKASQQWGSTGTVRVSETEKIYYQNDTLGGESGSPVWTYRSSGPCVGQCGLAIHTNGVFGSSGPSATNNSGTRLTQAKFNTIVSIINTP
jgi:glutamyl endopeptidase